MKICLITDYNVDTGYGTELWISDLAIFLKKKHQISVVSCRFGKSTNKYSDTLRNSGVKVTELDLSIDLKNKFSFRDWKRFYSLVKEADLLYLSGFSDKVKFFQFLLIKLSRRPFVLGHHGPTMERLKHDEFFRKSLFFKIFVIAPTIILDKFIRYHHVLNTDDFFYLSKLPGTTVWNIPNGIDRNRYYPTIKYEKFSILFSGRLVKLKGANLLGEIYKKINDKIDNFQFIITGDGALKEMIVALAEENKNISYLGYVSDKEMRIILAKSHVLISPTSIEGFPLTGLQSLASGTPIITFDVPGPREYIVDGKNGFLVNNLIQMAEKVLSVYDKWQYGKPYELMVNNAIDSSKKFSIESTFDDIEGILSSLSIIEKD